MSEATKKMPIVALRGMTVLPKMLIHFDIKRKVTVRAINEAMSGDQKVLLLTQIDPDTDKPKKADLYDVGTIGEIKQLIKLPNDKAYKISPVRKQKKSNLKKDKFLFEE